MDLSLKAKEIKAKINKWALLKFKSFCTAKESTDKTKRQTTKWEKIFSNYMTNRGLLSNIYKQFIQLKIKKTNNWIKKWTKGLNRHFSKEHVQMANKHMRRCSTLLVIREMQIKSTMRYYLTPARMAIIKKNTNNKYRWGYGEKGTLIHSRWECKLVQPLWKTGFSKN